MSHFWKTPDENLNWTSVGWSEARLCKDGNNVWERKESSITNKGKLFLPFTVTHPLKVFALTVHGSVSLLATTLTSTNGSCNAAYRQNYPPSAAGCWRASAKSLKCRRWCRFARGHNVTFTRWWHGSRIKPLKRYSLLKGCRDSVTEKTWKTNQRSVLQTLCGNYRSVLELWSIFFLILSATKIRLLYSPVALCPETGRDYFQMWINT